jgi:hypothetical protein
MVYDSPSKPGASENTMNCGTGSRSTTLALYLVLAYQLMTLEEQEQSLHIPDEHNLNVNLAALTNILG